MTGRTDSGIAAAEVRVACTDLDAAIAYFLDELGFRLDVIFPADAPRVAVVSGFGLRLRLDTDAKSGQAAIRLLCRDAGLVERAQGIVRAPNGTMIEFVHADPPLAMPPLEETLVIERADGRWGTGRAGMQYRDLIPGRLGGRFIASHIRIPIGGPVPDYVHHHHIRFQMIYCYRGWVRLVYEDQGPPFLMNAGDCVLQPPHIRHRVLECSDAFEVVEVGCPAEHETLVDHDMALPNDDVNTDRLFGGQRFVLHQAADASWSPAQMAGFELRDTGVAAATAGEASAVVLRASGDLEESPSSHHAEFLFRFVLEGSLTLHCDGHEDVALEAADAFVIPAGMRHWFSSVSDDLELLEVALPAGYRISV